MQQSLMYLQDHVIILNASERYEKCSDKILNGVKKYSNLNAKKNSKHKQIRYVFHAYLVNPDNDLLNSI